MPQARPQGTALQDMGQVRNNRFTCSFNAFKLLNILSCAAPQQSCQRRQETKCYTTPRQVSTQSCKRSEEKVCEKLSVRIPFPEERQVCHNEEKKVCELEQKTQPKQIKKYVYNKACRSVPKRVCENSDVKTLVPSCVPTTRKMCRSTPSEKCEDQPKQQCFKIPSIVRKEKCDTSDSYGDSGTTSTSTSSGYTAPAAHSAPYQ